MTEDELDLEVGRAYRERQDLTRKTACPKRRREPRDDWENLDKAYRRATEINEILVADDGLPSGVRS